MYPRASSSTPARAASSRSVLGVRPAATRMSEASSVLSVAPERTRSATPVPAPPRPSAHPETHKAPPPPARRRPPRGARPVRTPPFQGRGAVLDDRAAAAEPPHRLGELQADVAPAEDDEVAWQALQVQGFD